MKRNGYIDFIKFVFAIIIAEFHLNLGIFPAGRVAVEGFFIISGYLMLASMQREGGEIKSLGRSTVEFIFKKYKALFYFLLPSVILSYIVTSLYIERAFVEALKKAPLLLFEIVPLRSTGIKGEYVLGISWYLSTMLITLAVLYPLVKKFKKTTTLVVCPLIVLIGYGTLSGVYGHIAINNQYIKDTLIIAGVVRGFAGCALGCVLFEISKCVAKKTPTALARALFTALEVASFTYFIYLMHNYPKSMYEYLMIVPLFIFLFIGINGLSYTSYVLSPKWTKPLGIASTLIVLTHYCWTKYLPKILGNGYKSTTKVLWYVVAVTASCIIVYLFSILLKLLFARLAKIRLWKSEEKNS